MPTDRASQLVIDALAAIEKATAKVTELGKLALTQPPRPSGLLTMPDDATDEQLTRLREVWGRGTEVVRDTQRDEALAQLERDAALPTLLEHPTLEQRHHEIGLMLHHQVDLHRTPTAGCPLCPQTASVILFKESGKYYTEERWRIPERAIVPAEMERSPDFRRIGGGAVLVDTQEPWGYPHLFPNETEPDEPVRPRTAAELGIAGVTDDAQVSNDAARWTVDEPT